MRHRLLRRLGKRPLPVLNVDVLGSLPHGHPRGLDLGYDKFVVTSDGKEVKRPKFLKTLQYKLKLLSRRLRSKQKGSNNRHKLNQRIARLHQRISDTRKDWHFKLSHQLVQDTGMIFVESPLTPLIKGGIEGGIWQRGMLSKRRTTFVRQLRWRTAPAVADAGFGQFVNILKWVCWKTDTYFAKVNKNGTSQTCPNCGAHTGKKALDVRTHNCIECGYQTTRDVAASQEIRNRGINKVASLDFTSKACDDRAVGQTVVENVCGLDATGSIGNSVLVGTGRNRNPKS